ncbi:MAG: hypothetical protein ACLSUC_13255, partial [Subdoligranulum sp.]
PCFGSLFPPLAALTFAASRIICAFGLASAVPRAPYRHLELCGIAQCLYATSTCVVGNGLDRSGALPLQKSSASICFLIPFSAR